MYQFSTIQNLQNFKDNLQNDTHPRKNFDVVCGILRIEGVFSFVVGDETAAPAHTRTLVTKNI